LAKTGVREYLAIL